MPLRLPPSQPAVLFHPCRATGAFITLCIALLAAITTAEITGPLTVSDNGRYFVGQDGKAFFWLCDTHHPLFSEHSLSDIAEILDDRAAKGFTAIRAMVVCTPCGDDWINVDGQIAYFSRDLLQPNEAYFARVDSIIELCRERDMYILISLTHHTMGTRINLSNGREVGRYVGRRWARFPNVLWAPYNAVPTADNLALFREIAGGILEGDTASHLMTVHPDPSIFSSEYLHNEPWLDFHCLQTCVSYDYLYDEVYDDYQLSPPKPVVMNEGGYEGTEFGRLQTPLEIRKQAWWSHLAGGHHTYGNNNEWQDPYSWRSWIGSPGAAHCGIYRGIITSLPKWWTWVPDQSIITSGKGDGMSLSAACCAAGGEWVLVYVARSTTVGIDVTPAGGDGAFDAVWFDPATGDSTFIATHPAGETKQYTTPQGWQDAVLVLMREGATKAGPDPQKPFTAGRSLSSFSVVPYINGFCPVRGTDGNERRPVGIFTYTGQRCPVRLDRGNAPGGFAHGIYIIRYPPE